MPFGGERSGDVLCDVDICRSILRGHTLRTKADRPAAFTLTVNVMVE